MSDAEIIKALECCANLEACEKCPMCSFEKYDTDTCEHQIMLYSLDLINHQKAEIERLREEIKEHIKIGVSKRKYDINLIKAEAYKEFAEEVNKELFGEEYQLDKVHRRAVERILNRLTSKE